MNGRAGLDCQRFLLTTSLSLLLPLSDTSLLSLSLILCVSLSQHYTLQVIVELKITTDKGSTAGYGH